MADVVIGRVSIGLNANARPMQSALSRIRRALRGGGRQFDRFSRSTNKATRSSNLFRRALLRLGVAFGAYLGARGIVNAVRNTAQWADEQVNLSQKTGIATRSLQGQLAILRVFGVQGREYADLLNTMSQRLNEFQRGDATAVDVFTALGIGATDATGRLKTAQQGLTDFIQAYNRLRTVDPTQATALLSQLFGGGAALQIEPFLQRFTEQNIRSLERLSGGALADRDIQGLAELSFNIRALGQIFTNQFRRFIARFAPQINIMVRALQQSIPRAFNLLASILNRFLGGIDLNLTNVVAAMQVTARVISDRLLPVVNTIFLLLKNAALANIARFFRDFGQGFGRAGQIATLPLVASLFAAIVSDFDQIFTGIGQGVSISVQGFSKSVTEQAQKISLQLDESFGGVQQAADDLTTSFLNLSANLQSQVRQALDRLRTTADNIQQGNRLAPLSAQQRQRESALAQILELTKTTQEQLIDSIDSLTMQMRVANRNIFGSLAATPPVPLPRPVRIDLGDAEELQGGTISILGRVFTAIQDFVVGIPAAFRNAFNQIIGFPPAQAQTGVDQRTLQQILGVLQDDQGNQITPGIPRISPGVQLVPPLPQVPPQPTVERAVEQAVQPILNDFTQGFAQIAAQLELQGNRLRRARADLEIIRSLALVLQGDTQTTALEREVDKQINRVDEGLNVKYARLRLQRRLHIDLDVTRGIEDFRRRVQDFLLGVDRGLQDSVSRIRNRSVFSQTLANLQSQTNRMIDDRRLQLERAVRDLEIARDSAQSAFQQSLPGSADALQQARERLQGARIAQDQFNDAVRNGTTDIQVNAQNIALQSQALSQLQQLANSLQSAFSNAFQRIIFEGQGLESAFKSLVQTVIQQILRIAVIQPIVQGIAGAIGGAIGAGTGVPGFQRGGIGRGLAIVGEAGPELIYSPDRFGVIPNNAINFGGGDTFVFNVDGGMNADELRRVYQAELKPDLVQTIEQRNERSLRSKNSPLSKGIRRVSGRT